MTKRLDPAARFDAKVNFAGPVPTDFRDPCWLWTGPTTGNGYAQFTTGGRGSPRALVHRWNYKRHVGAIPNGWQVDHLCKIRHCVNPAHLEAVPQRVNNARSESPSAKNARKTHCPQGHRLAGDNLHPTYLRVGQRKCVTCHRASVALTNAKRKLKSLS